MINQIIRTLIITFVITSTYCFANEAHEALGERMFNDTRFSEFFLTASAGDANTELEESFDNLKAVSCSSCHKVDQEFEPSIGGMRGYNDFSRRTQVPQRDDNQTVTLRNTPALVGIGSKYAKNRFSHYDGEFSDHSETVLGNFTGRNMGWQRADKNRALANIAHVIRNDKGHGQLAQEFGGLSYAAVMLGVDPALSDANRIDESVRVDVYKLNDEQIIDSVIFFITAYMNGIDFEKNEQGVYTGSVYDDFLRANNLALEPTGTQSIVDYTVELRRAINELVSPKFIKAKRLDTYNRSFKFGENEFEGMKVFFNLRSSSQSRGMCINCHMPPLYTDHFFHNIGVAQVEYDQTHGQGAFNKLSVPALSSRGDQYFLSRVQRNDMDGADLGMWNFFAREGKEVLTNYVRSELCAPDRDCSHEFLLPFMLGRMKTPTLRNLAQSEPYLHNGSAQDLDAVIKHYNDVGILTRKRLLRNGAPQLRMININDQGSRDLKAFLDTLNSDYE